MFGALLKRNQRLLATALSGVMLFAALAPAVVQWLAFTQGAHSVWAELCTANGIKLVKVKDTVAADSDPSTAGHKTQTHCPLCVLHAGLDMAVPSLPVQRITSVAELNLVPRLFYLSPKPLYAWASARSRAPPLAAS